jgi:hypothetical protein
MGIAPVAVALSDLTVLVVDKVLDFVGFRHSSTVRLRFGLRVVGLAYPCSTLTAVRPAVAVGHSVNRTVLGHGLSLRARSKTRRHVDGTPGSPRSCVTRPSLMDPNARETGSWPNFGYARPVAHANITWSVSGETSNSTGNAVAQRLSEAGFVRRGKTAFRSAHDVPLEVIIDAVRDALSTLHTAPGCGRMDHVFLSIEGDALDGPVEPEDFDGSN